MSFVAFRLEDEGVISCRGLFTLGVRLADKQGELKAGEYLIRAGASQRHIMDMLVSGKTYQRKITVPEGLTSFQIVRLLKDEPALSGVIEQVPPEGSLLPETYSYHRGEDRNGIIVRMQDAMEEALDELWEGRSENLPFDTPQEAVVLASIVEKEAGVKAERSRIAGVFVNRLRKGMPLQSDPTVIYAITEGEHQDEGSGPLGRRLTLKDLETDSPYNTYKYAGLPPQPIANPGKESLEAALRPQSHGYYYFVADGTGGHAFSATLKQHNQSVMKWRQIRGGSRRSK